MVMGVRLLELLVVDMRYEPRVAMKNMMKEIVTMFEKFKKYSLYNYAENECLLFIWWICFSVVLLILLSSFSCTMCSCNIQKPAKGYFSGYITQIWEQDNITWDSTIVEVRTGIDRYKLCVCNDVVATELETALRNKKRITLKYERNSWILWNWECNAAPYIATGVEK